MWSATVIGTHPVEENQRVWLELLADELDLGRIPAYWIENKGGTATGMPRFLLRRSEYGSIIGRSPSTTARRAHRAPTRTRSSVLTCPTGPSPLT